MKTKFTIERLEHASDSEWDRVCDILSEAVENHAKCSAQSLPREKWQEEFVDESGNFDRRLYADQCDRWNTMMTTGRGRVYVARTDKDIVGALVVMPNGHIPRLMDFVYCSVCKEHRRKRVALVLSIYALNDLGDSGVVFVNISHDNNNPSGKALNKSVTRHHSGIPFICNAKDFIYWNPLFGPMKVVRNGETVLDLTSKIKTIYGLV